MRKVFNFIELKNNTSKKSELSRELLFFNGGILYRIYNEHNNKSYIGITKNLYGRIYSSKFGHLSRCLGTASIESDSDLYKDMRFELESFHIEVIIFSLRVEDVSSLEKYFITKFDSFNNGYNTTSNGKAFGLKGVAGMKGKWRFMHRNIGEDTLVPLDKVPEYEDNGYILGRSKENYSKGTTFVHKGRENKRIKNNELDEFLKSNPDWSLGRVYGRVYDTGFKLLWKDGVKKKFRKEDLDKAYSEGWVSKSSK